MKKIITFLLVLTMVFSMVACGNAENNENASNNVETPNASDSDNASDDAGEIKDVTLSVFVVTQGDLTSGIADDPVAQLIKEKTGVTMDIVAYDADKHNAMVASGDLYDVTVIVGADSIAPLIKQEAVADLTNWIDQAPNAAQKTELLNYSKNYLSADTGNLYVLPLRVKDAEVPMASDQNGNFIRWDHYVEAGQPEINSNEDLLELLETIQKNHPTNDNGQKAYGVSCFVDWGTQLYTPLEKYVGELKLDGNYGSYDMNSLEFHSILDDENMWVQNAQFLFDANQRGILDPEACTQKYEDYVNKLNDGRVLSSMFEFASRDATNNLENADQAGFVDIPYADTAEFPAFVNRSVPFGYTQRLLVVSSKCDDEKMAAAMRLIDFIYSEDGARSILNGPQGIVWDYDENGVACFTDEALNAMATDSGYLNSQAASWHTGMVGYDFDAYDSNGRFLNLTMNADYIQSSMKDYEKEYCEFYGVDGPLEVLSTRENQATENKGITSFMPTEIPTDVSRIIASADQYLSKELYNLVLSADQAAFDAKLAEIREELVKMDYETVINWYKEAWENAIASYNAVVG